MAPRLKTIDANGLSFAYFAEGDGPLALMLHGFPDTPHTWDEVRPAVAKLGLRVVTPFMRGYAPTEIPEDGAYDADTLGRDVLALIEAFGEREAIVIGHDWGAVAAFSTVGLDPAKVRHLVTVGIPHPASIVPTPKVLWTLRHFVTLRLPGAAARIRAGGFTLIDDLVQRWSPAWTVPPGETEAVKRSLSAPGSLEAALGYYRALSPRVPASQRRLVTVPATAFAGLHDNVSPEVYERARPRYRGSYEVVPVPGGHFMHREHPRPFIDALTGALAPLAAHAPK